MRTIFFNCLWFLQLRCLSDSTLPFVSDHEGGLRGGAREIFIRYVAGGAGGVSVGVVALVVGPDGLLVGLHQGGGAGVAPGQGAHVLKGDAGVGQSHGAYARYGAPVAGPVAPSGQGAVGQGWWYGILLTTKKHQNLNDGAKRQVLEEGTAKANTICSVYVYESPAARSQ